MKLIFIAGAYRAPTEWEIIENIRKAEALAIKVWQAGMVAICPHKNTAHFGGLCDDSVWIEGALELLTLCDAIIVAPGWYKSKGTQGERAKAMKLGIPIFYHMSDLIRWARK